MLGTAPPYSNSLWLLLRAFANWVLHTFGYRGFRALGGLGLYGFRALGFRGLGF